MRDSLSHPDTGVGPHQETPTGTSRWQKAVAILGVLVVLWVANDTYKIIDADSGRGGHQAPAQNTPVENQDQDPDADSGGGHQPPAGGHG